VDRVKGADVLIRAVLSLPGDAPVELRIHGVVQNGADAELRHLQALARGDGRVRFEAPVGPQDVVSMLADSDVLAVPSQGMETGPLVVLEAFAAGTPVLGSGLGGISELVVHDVNGLLVGNYRSARAWAAALTRLAHEPDTVARLSAGTVVPEGMDRVADQMLAIYGEVVSQRASRNPRNVPAA
jgi:glycosyltransferase involved in cell wall biosynthesis